MFSLQCARYDVDWKKSHFEMVCTIGRSLIEGAIPYRKLMDDNQPVGNRDGYDAMSGGEILFDMYFNSC